MVWSTASRTLLATAALAALALPATGQEREASGEPVVAVSGVVAERSTGEPVEAAAVRLIPVGDAEPLARLTDASGRFHVPDIPSGRYRLLVEKFGFETVEAAIELLAESDVRVGLT